jgi:hypothetical protein
MQDQRVDDYIGSLEGWKREAVTRLRELIHQAVPAIGEDWKWDTPLR